MANAFQHGGCSSIEYILDRLYQLGNFTSRLLVANYWLVRIEQARLGFISVATKLVLLTKEIYKRATFVRDIIHHMAGNSPGLTLVLTWRRSNIYISGVEIHRMMQVIASSRKEVFRPECFLVAFLLA
jgi:hypothetical protein